MVIAPGEKIPVGTLNVLEHNRDGPNGWQTLSVAGEGKNPTEDDLDRLAKDVGLR